VVGSPLVEVLGVDADDEGAHADGRAHIGLV
jgi:hypothetical protein